LIHTNIHVKVTEDNYSWWQSLANQGEMIICYKFIAVYKN